MILKVTIICICLLLTFQEVTSATVTYTFNVTYGYESPDGVNRRIITVNNSWPPPTIQANKGDRLIVQVYNSLEEATAMHWHGIHQKGSQVMDGVYQTTQCPIAPGQMYTYDFTLNQTGTYWWHSHINTQYIDGIRGPLIISDPIDPHLSLYDDDTQILEISDWYHNQSESMLQDFLSTKNPGGVEPIPDSGLINNLGTFDCTLPTYGMTCNSYQPLFATTPFVPGRRYRIRLINTSGIANFNVSIDNHKMLVIEADGVSVQPVEVDRLEIATAQRYSVIVVANQTASNYWIRATMSNGLFDLKPELNKNVGAILRYQGAPIANPTANLSTEIPTGVFLNDNMLVPVNAQDAPTVVTSITTFSFAFMTTYDGDNRAFVSLNGSDWVSYMFPHVPTLYRLISGQPALPTTLPINTVSNTATDIIVNNIDGEAHPFHLHGHWFWIVATGDGIIENNNFTANTNNPPLRDTVNVPGNGYTVIRFLADNPGAWLFHCHIEWHMPAGLVATVIEPYPDQTFAEALSISSSQSNLCVSGANYMPIGNEPIKVPIILPDTSKGYAGLPGSTPLLWDVSSCCSETSNGFFQILSALTGWRARPTVLTTCIYFGYWVLVALGFLFRKIRIKRGCDRKNAIEEDDDDEYSLVLPLSPEYKPSQITNQDAVTPINASEGKLISPLDSPKISSRNSWPAGARVTSGI